MSVCIAVPLQTHTKHSHTLPVTAKSLRHYHFTAFNMKSNFFTVLPHTRLRWVGRGNCFYEPWDSNGTGLQTISEECIVLLSYFAKDTLLGCFLDCENDVFLGIFTYVPNKARLVFMLILHQSGARELT